MLMTGGAAAKAGDQAGACRRIRRRRAAPAKPKPTSIIDQVAGSGTLARVRFSGAKSEIWEFLPAPLRGHRLKP